MQRAVNRLARSGEALAAGDLTTVAATVTCAHALVCTWCSCFRGPFPKGVAGFQQCCPTTRVKSSHVPALCIHMLVLDDLPGLVQP